MTTAQAIIKPIPSYIEATGNLASDAQTDVAPAVGGKIVEVNFDIGSYVQQGDVLVRLDPRDANIRLEQAKAQVEQQRQAVQQAEANVDQAIANLRQTQARLGVKDGETFQIKDFSQVKTFTAQLDLAEKELRRTERLLESGDVSKSAYDQRKSQRDALIGNLDEARSNAAVAIRAINTAQAAVGTASRLFQAAAGCGNNRRDSGDTGPEVGGRYDSAGSDQRFCFGKDRGRRRVYIAKHAKLKGCDNRSYINLADEDRCPGTVDRKSG